MTFQGTMARDLRGMSGKFGAAREPRAASNAVWRSGGVRADLRGRCVAILVAVLLAFSWQSFVAQTHVHFASAVDATTIAVRADGAADASVKPSSSDEPADCPICDEIAHAGHIYLPASLSFHIPERAEAWIILAAAGIVAPSQSSHAWNSRAPPHHLQA
jgi:hypothetical protein